MKNRTKAILYSFLIAFLCAMVFVFSYPIGIGVFFVYGATFFGYLTYRKYDLQTKFSDWWVVSSVFGLSFLAIFLGNAFSLAIYEKINYFSALARSFTQIGTYWFIYLIYLILICLFSALGWLSSSQYIKRREISNQKKLEESSVETQSEQK